MSQDGINGSPDSSDSRRLLRTIGRAVVNQTASPTAFEVALFRIRRGALHRADREASHSRCIFFGVFLAGVRLARTSKPTATGQTNAATRQPCIEGDRHAKTATFTAETVTSLLDTQSVIREIDGARLWLKRPLAESGGTQNLRVPLALPGLRRPFETKPKTRACKPADHAEGGSKGKTFGLVHGTADDFAQPKKLPESFSFQRFAQSHTSSASHQMNDCPVLTSVVTRSAVRPAAGRGRSDAKFRGEPSRLAFINLNKKSQKNPGNTQFSGLHSSAIGGMRIRRAVFTRIRKKTRRTMLTVRILSVM